MKVLILAFDPEKMITAANIINQYHLANPKAEIHVACFAESSEHAQQLPQIKKIHTIDRKKIHTFKERQIYSDAHSLNLFWNSIQTLNNETWDELYTFSQNTFSYLIAGYLNTKNIKGTYYNNQKSLTFSSTSAIIEHGFDQHNSPIHCLDLGSQTCGIKAFKIASVNIEREYLNLANENFKIIRKKLASSKKDVKFVGIQFHHTERSHLLEEHELISLIDKLYNSESYYPILIINGTAEEKEIVNLINKSFNNQIITINADLNVVGAVLKNLDFLVCVEQSYQQLADLCETSSLTIRDEHGFYYNGSILINSLTTIRNEKLNNIGPNLYSIVEFYFEDKVIEKSELDLYATTQDKMGVTYVSISKKSNFTELASTFNRAISAKIFYQIDLTPKLHIDELTVTYLTQEKIKLTEVLKMLLSVIRSFINAKNSTRNSAEFLNGLDKLFAITTEKNLCSLPCLYFKTKIENAPYLSKEENYQFVEKSLFELKNNLQVINQIMSNALDQVTRPATTAAQPTKEVNL